MATSVKIKFNNSVKKDRMKLSLFNVMQERINHLKEIGKERTSETYKSALISFAKFRNNRDILFEYIDCNLMESYQAWLYKQNLTPNTISFYMRILRAVYNTAVDMNITEQKKPFRHVYTGVEKTVKRAISLKELKRIKQVNLPQNPGILFARDIFLFSFYTRGMSFIDIAYLKKENLKNGTLSYRRKKTGQQLHIKWESCMQEIVSRYPSNTPYLLPIINNPNGNERKQYLTRLSYINKQLKKIATLSGLNIFYLCM